MHFHINQTKLFGNKHCDVTAVRADTIGVALIIGQSNGNGTATDATYSEETLAASHPGLTCVFRDKGNNLNTYGNLDVGPVPYLFNKMGTETSTPIIIRRSINGAGENSVRDTQLAGAIADIKALNLNYSDVKLVWLIHGEEDSTSESQANNYRDFALERICQLYEATFPNAIVAINYLASTTYGDYFATVRLAQTEAVSRRNNRKLVNTLTSPAVEILFDGVHYAANANGFGRATDKMWTAIAD